jgi:hypothetical protein
MRLPLPLTFPLRTFPRIVSPQRSERIANIKKTTPRIASAFLTSAAVLGATTVPPDANPCVGNRDDNVRLFCTGRR